MSIDDPRRVIAEIKTAREKFHHWKQWPNESSCQKKASKWKRRLTRALATARAANLEIPADPFAPPPPPPTEEEVAETVLAALLKRRRFDWQVQRGFNGWAPWGESGWSAITVSTANHKWCQVQRVNAKTGEMIASGKVRRERLISRDPKLEGKDKPHVPPTAVWADAATPKTDPVPAPARPIPPKTVFYDTKEEEPAPRQETTMPLIDDESTDDDW